MFRRKTKHRKYVVKSVFQVRKSIVTAALKMSLTTDEDAIHYYNKIIIVRSNLLRKYSKRNHLINF